MTYNLYYCSEDTRTLKGSYEAYDDVLEGFHTICRDEMKLGAYACLIENNHIDYGGNKHWFEIEEVK
ncbi:hypothetical protein [Streptococcus uberis]|uniref:hypothetical protein n=1 Tax=Streptococcus uberis TaxID=1349 RepID=UPI00389208C7